MINWVEDVLEHYFSLAGSSGPVAWAATITFRLRLRRIPLQRGLRGAHRPATWRQALTHVCGAVPTQGRRCLRLIFCRSGSPTTGHAHCAGWPPRCAPSCPTRCGCRFACRGAPGHRPTMSRQDPQGSLGCLLVEKTRRVGHGYPVGDCCRRPVACRRPTYTCWWLARSRARISAQRGLFIAEPSTPCGRGRS
jgi:hypothetical protein